MRSKKVSVFLWPFILCMAVVFGASLHIARPVEASSVKTGVGLAEHALKAYQEGWNYRYGCYGQVAGGVRSSDCSGLIKSYLWWTNDQTNPDPSLMSVAGSSTAMLASATEKGNINLSDSSSLPRIHGLVLYSPGHVGVYIGNNREADNRESGTNMRCQKVFGGTYRWTKWFKLPQIQYPTTGFVTFEGKQYYYENSEYIVNTTRTIDGKTYTFDSSGAVQSSEASGEVEKAEKETYPKPEVLTELRMGSQGSDVQALEKRLGDLGFYHEKIGSSYDVYLRDAISAYQWAAGMQGTGYATVETQESIYSPFAERCTGETLEYGLHSSLVTEMQKKLISLGYLYGNPTGYFGKETQAAVMKFQDAENLSQTGSMDPNALAVLYSK